MPPIYPGRIEIESETRIRRTFRDMNRNLRLGILIVSGSLLLMLGLFAIGSRTFLFSSVVQVRSQFSSVAGLQAGASVQYQGVSVGRVESVSLPDQPGQKIVVEMSISERASHLIRKNTQAQIKSDGLVGEQIIVLVSAAEPSEPVENEDFLPGVDPFDLFEITDRALASVQDFERAANVFEEIMKDIQRGEGTLGRIIYDSTLYVSLVQTTDETRRVMTNRASSAEANADVLVDLATQATAGINSILAKADSGNGTLALMLNDPRFYNELLASADTLRGIAADLKAVSSTAENAAIWGSLGAFRFAELMEAAKHNWLFKRYFEERGSMDLAPFELRERAVSESMEDISNRERELLMWETRLREWEAELAAKQDSTGNQ